MEGAGRRSLWLSDSVAEENGAQKKKALDTSSLVSLLPESVCQGGAHIDRKNSNSVAMARRRGQLEFSSASQAGRVHMSTCVTPSRRRSGGQETDFGKMHVEDMIGSKRMTRCVGAGQGERTDRPAWRTGK